MRAARGLLGWSQIQLAEACGLGIATVERMEASDGLLRGSATNVWKHQQALEKAGVEFIGPNGGGPGVRLKSMPKEAEC